MSVNKTTLLITLLFLSIFGAFGQQEQKAPTPEEYAETECERLGRVYKLDDWQMFYVDSTLRHDFTVMMEELGKLRKARVENVDLYYSIRDEWNEKIQASYQRIFTEEQWAAYMKQEGARQIKEREKRRAKRENKKK
ncbi:MAG: hypothetical protein MJY92_08165 [Bacteroidales bacterium]|nr:hypothetical protein [Bacteroidales bacterium]